jgi:hypothetical protein
MPSSMICRVALVRTDVSEERIAFIIRVTRIGNLGTLAVTSNRHSMLQLLVTAKVPSSPIRHPDDGSDMFLRNIGSYKSHTA